MKKDVSNMKKIEKLDPAFMGSNAGSCGASIDEVVLKINEIIDALNGKEEPELTESEDERIRKGLIDMFQRHPYCEINGLKTKDIVAWLEKQKESLHIPESCKENDDSFTDEYERTRKELIEQVEKSKHHPADKERWIAWLEKQKEQKPAPTEDMPYITDEHFYEREPADSFKYKLAEYMTRCCTKKEGPYGYEYGISAESILKMAEEELLKRGVVQKPAEGGSSEKPNNQWSEEDEKPFNDVLSGLKYAYEDLINNKSFDSAKDIKEAFDWMQARVKFFRPQPKQEWSEEDVKRLYSIGTQIGFLKGKYSECQKDIDWLHALAEKMGFHKCKTGEVITEWKKEDIDDKMLSKPKPEWSEEDEKMLDAYADEITDWCGKFNPELRDVIRATAYHFYTFRPHWLLDTMVEQGIFNKEDKK